MTGSEHVTQANATCMVPDKDTGSTGVGSLIFSACVCVCVFACLFVSCVCEHVSACSPGAGKAGEPVALA